MPETIRRGYEIFQLCGSFGGTETIARAKFRADYGEGYSTSALFGAKTGLKTWRLKFDGTALPQMLGSNNPTSLNDEEVTRADYLWEFWNRFDATGEPFVFKPKRNGQYYLAEFLDTELTYEQFRSRLWTTGLTLRQRKVPGVSVYDPSLTPYGTRFYNVTELDYANDSSVTTLPDSIGTEDLTGTATKPVYKTNIQNGNGVIRFNGTNNALTNSTPFTFRHIFIISKYAGTTFADYDGLVNGLGTEQLLVGMPGETVFRPMSDSPPDVDAVFTVKVNGLEVDSEAVPGPMNTFSLIEIRADREVAMTGLQIGKFLTETWTGDIGSIFIAQKKMNEIDVWELEEELMRLWSIN